MAYHICESCAVAILSGDMGHLDESREAYDRLVEFVEDRGLLVDAGMVPQGGYWDCEACGEVQIAGVAQAVEQD